METKIRSSRVGQTTGSITLESVIGLSAACLAADSDDLAHHSDLMSPGA